LRVTLQGTRGSVGRAGTDTLRYGGDTSSVSIENGGDDLVLLDAGSGIVHTHDLVTPHTRRIDILLSHLHIDHIQGLGFFRPLFNPEIETHIWGPATATASLFDRLARYLSPPLFPVRLRDLPSLHLHDVHAGPMPVPGFDVRADFVIHPGPTMGFRIGRDDKAMAYLPDHEPALGSPTMKSPVEWLSGHRLADGVDLLIHDAQYTDDEYAARVGWGHSTYGHGVALASAASVGKLVTFHHDPDHSDELLDRLHDEARREGLGFELIPGWSGASWEV